MNKTINPRLTAKVASRNQVNALANKLSPDFLAAITPFVGTPIILASGGFAHKFRKVVDSLTAQRPDCRIWISSGHGYSLTANISVNVPVDGQCGVQYAEETIYLGDLKGALLENRKDAFPRRENYTVAEILEARTELDAARKEVSAAQSKLNGFGEHDNH